MKSLLVTGGAGFIGSNFVLYWLNKYPEDKVVVLDALTYAGNKENLASVEENNQLTFVKGDICNTALVEELMQEHNTCTIVHFAAESHVDRSITGPDAFIETNILGTHSLLKAARNIWLDIPKSEGGQPAEHRFHHVSTDEVYGTLEADDPAFSETTAYAPNSPYSASKAASDHLVRAYHHTYGLNVTTSNCSNNYGPLQFAEKLIPLVITNILSNKVLPIYGDGLQVRDWLYVKDHVRCIDLIINNGLSGETYNVGGESERSNIDVVKTICQIMNEFFATNDTLAIKYPTAEYAIEGRAEKLIIFVNDRPGHDRRYAINPEKIRQELSYLPQESFESGIKKTIEWYMNN